MEDGGDVSVEGGREGREGEYGYERISNSRMGERKNARKRMTERPSTSIMVGGQG